MGGEGDTRWKFNIGGRKWLRYRREHWRVLLSRAVLSQEDCVCDSVHYFPFILLSENATLGFWIDVISSFLHGGSLHLITVLTCIPDSHQFLHFTHGKLGCDWICLLKSYQLCSHTSLKDFYTRPVTSIVLFLFVCFSRKNGSFFFIKFIPLASSGQSLEKTVGTCNHEGNHWSHGELLDI